MGLPTTPTISTRTNGQTIDETWFNTIKTVAEDHEERVQDLENLVREIWFRVGGLYGDDNTTTSVPINQVTTYRVQEDIHLTSGQLFIETAGISGTTQIDIKRKTGVGAFTTIFTTKPSAAFGAGDLYTSTNGALDTAQDDLLAGDWLRLDLTSLQVDGEGLAAILKYTRS